MLVKDGIDGVGGRASEMECTHRHYVNPAVPARLQRRLMNKPYGQREQCRLQLLQRTVDEQT
jgi:hypothetical protein